MKVYLSAIYILFFLACSQKKNEAVSYNYYGTSKWPQSKEFVTKNHGDTILLSGFLEFQNDQQIFKEDFGSIENYLWINDPQNQLQIENLSDKSIRILGVLDSTVKSSDQIGGIHLIAF